MHRTRKAILPIPVTSSWRTAYISKVTILSFPLTQSLLVVLVVVRVAAGMGSLTGRQVVTFSTRSLLE